MKLLDCTLRDGGYANNWQWHVKLAQNIVHALNKSDVDYIEIGYRRPNGEGFTYCGDKFVKKYFSEHKNLAVMIDVKDYLIKGANVLDVPLLEKHFKKDSPISMVRVASNPIFNELLASRLATQYLTDIGYKTTVNVMKMTRIGKEEKKLIDNILPSLLHLTYLYYADSYGNLTDFVDDLYYDDIPGGFHGHNNKGMAFALSNGFEGIVDGSIGGVGRGAGNLDTIQMLLERDGKFPYELYKLLKQVKRIKTMAQCGYSYEYHYAGIHNIHPMYVYNLKEMHKYGSYKIIEILSKIPEEKRSSCDMECLEELL